MCLGLNPTAWKIGNNPDMKLQMRTKPLSNYSENIPLADTGKLTKDKKKFNLGRKPDDIYPGA